MILEINRLAAESANRAQQEIVVLQNAKLELESISTSISTRTKTRTD